MISIDILLVEDSPGDARLAAEALAESRLQGDVLHVVINGVEALAYLNQEGDYAQAVRPDLILLDLNLPGKHGRQVLAEIKGNDTLRSIPVVVLTTSRSKSDIAECYGLNANAYVTKPIDFDEFLAAVRAIHCFWVETASLPPRDTCLPSRQPFDRPPDAPPTAAWTL